MFVTKIDKQLHGYDQIVVGGVSDVQGRCLSGEMTHDSHLIKKKITAAAAPPLEDQFF